MIPDRMLRPLLLGATKHPTSILSPNLPPKKQKTSGLPPQQKPKYVQTFTPLPCYPDHLWILLKCGADVRVCTCICNSFCLCQNPPPNAKQTQCKHFHSRWAAAFTPSNGHFSGHLPTVTSSKTPALERIYYNSLLTLISLERTNLELMAPRVFLTSSGNVCK